MNRPRTALDKLVASDRVIAKINEQFARLENAVHAPRKEPLSKGVIPTIFNECDPSCPTCALERNYARRKLRLGEIQRAALLENARADFRKRALRQQTNRANAKRPRKRRQSAENTLRLLGLRCVLRQYPDITAKSLCEMLEVEPLTYDDDDIKLLGNLNSIVVLDLKSRATIASALINKSSLRTYLSKARNG